ncbi:putative serpin-Z5 [Trichogramma pretiosum]|uniref:putative serpin-Z5 n=1 Tax=Trichogramma pretiosum TaxID=7493 RepID=UPI000C71C450|nr:putative serpin-Z5 [Trichogramma pretiosum]
MNELFYKVRSLWVFFKYQNYYYPGHRQVAQPRAPTYQTNIGYRNSNAVQNPLDVFRDILSRQTMQLTLYIDRQLKTVAEKPNVVFSPLSLQMLLANILLASKGQTYNEIAKIFNINSNSEKNFHENFGKLIEQTFYGRSGIEGPKVDYGTGVFLTKDLPVSKTFESESKRFYKTLARGINYRNGEAQNIINDWVKSATHGLIDTIVNQPPKYDTKAIIASALYFKGKWANRFDIN